MRQRGAAKNCWKVHSWGDVPKLAGILFLPPGLEGEGQLCKLPFWEGEVWVVLGGVLPSCLAALQHSPWDLGFGNGFGQETYLGPVTETSPAFCLQ